MCEQMSVPYTATSMNISSSTLEPKFVHVLKCKMNPKIIRVRGTQQFVLHLFLKAKWSGSTYLVKQQTEWKGE